MNYKKYIFTTGMVLVTLILNADPSAFEVADQLNLVPTPQSISLTGSTYPVDEDWKILYSHEDALIQTGVWEINERIGKLGGQPLENAAVSYNGPMMIIAKEGDALAKRYESSMSARTNLGDEQGYRIELVEISGYPALLGIGTDSCGALYACMTIRQLLQLDDSGKIILHGARIRDWPAFKRRCLGNIGKSWKGRTLVPNDKTLEDIWLEEAKEYVRFLARRKVNFCNISPPGSIAEKVEPIMDAFCESYGIHFRYAFGTSINAELEETGNAWTDCVMRREAMHCWTAFEEHRLKAHKLADLIHDRGYDYVILHVTDSGGLADPEKWTERCDRCRQVYGDNHARAAADQLRLYYDIISEKNPDIMYEAVIQPYHFQFTLDDFCDDPETIYQDMPHQGGLDVLLGEGACEERSENASRIHRAVADALPSDALFTYREGSREGFEGACELWQGHPIDVWVYYGRNMAWEGLWEPQVRFSKTWYRDDPRDVLYNAPVGRMTTVNEIYAAGSAEYAWNVNQPDASMEFKLASRRYPVEGKNVTPFQQKSLLPRLVRLLWGSSGKSVLPLFQNNISFNYIGMPEYVTRSRGEALADPYVYWDEQVEVLRTAQFLINSEMDRIDAGLTSGVYGDLRVEPGYKSFVMLYYYTNLAAGKGEIEQGIQSAKSAVAAGNIEQARDIIEALKLRAKDIATDMNRVKQRVYDDERLQFRPDYIPMGQNKRPVRNALNGYAFEDMPQRLELLLDQLLGDASLNGIPSHLYNDLIHRRITVAPREGDVDIDGKPDESAWKYGPVIEFLVREDGRTLDADITRVRMLYDEKGIYVGGELFAGKSEQGLIDFESMKDQIEIRLSPSNDLIHRYVLSKTGNLQHFIDGDDASDTSAAFSVSLDSKGRMWTFEGFIPYADMGISSKGNWTADLVRIHDDAGDRKIVSSLTNLSGKDIQEELIPVDFSSQMPDNRNLGEARILRANRSDETTTYGFATQVSIVPEIKSNRQAGPGEVLIRIKQGEKEILSRTIPIKVFHGYWTSRQPVDFDLGAEYAGNVEVTVVARSDDNALYAAETFTLTEKGDIR